MTLQDVTTSTHKYPRSCVNVKIYRGRGSQQGWHFDTNTITALLYLSTNQEARHLLRDHPRSPERGHAD